MKIALLNERITIQKVEVVKDKIGNHFNRWSDYFNLYATISSESPTEVTAAGNVWDESKIDFTVRYSNEIKDITSTNYRVVFKNTVYQIKGIDHMNYKKKTIKLHCQRCEDEKD
ncbi:phage head closure protein [Ligilactobacillus ceti]|uniref:phage head closure protein n=1 Tax=Ligilactobacillus ceti TaxID=395085 RepID=UPI0004839809|nr:phage head closure protein [Ligilactobacillus ceti]